MKRIVTNRLLSRLANMVDNMRHGYIALFIDDVEQRPRHYRHLTWDLEGDSIMVFWDDHVQWIAEREGAAVVRVFDSATGGKELFVTRLLKSCSKGDTVVLEPSGGSVGH